MRSVADEGLERNVNLIPSGITKMIEFKVVDTIMLARAFYVKACYTCILHSTAVGRQFKEFSATIKPYLLYD